jgi:hypothetical protein
MARRLDWKSRSTIEWSVRAALALVAAAIGYGSVAHTLGATLRTGSPAKAYGLATGDGRITAQYAQTKAGAGATTAERQQADRLARLALRQDPTAVSAVSVLGLDAQLRGDIAGGRRLMRYAQALSRRDLQTQVWAIEDAVARGDVPGALRHYDIALRTSRTASDLLFPVLSLAIAEPAIRVALTKTMAAGPSWAGSFVDYVTTHGSNAEATAELLRSLNRTGMKLPEGANAASISGLLAAGKIDDAWSYFASIRPGANRRVSRDPHFNTTPAAPSPFDWIAVNEGGIATSIQRGDRGGLFDFSAPSSVGGVLLSQVQLLPPGYYRLVGRSNNVDAPDDARPYWQLTCRNGTELGRVDIPGSSDRGINFVGTFTVPAGCPMQTLSLIARPVDNVAGLSGQIEQVQLAPKR